MSDVVSSRDHITYSFDVGIIEFGADKIFVSVGIRNIKELKDFPNLRVSGIPYNIRPKLTDEIGYGSATVGRNVVMDKFANSGLYFRAECYD